MLHGSFERRNYLTMYLCVVSISLNQNQHSYLILLHHVLSAR